ncbi:hypothetical protein LIER_13737 [Lithospermum erythrorhizon]|uniref:Uncharacterized protein n=1 Tax=Lithospermum erythrorhizon TaxID=34254 RepID=A0AAV3PY21_LITER
MAIQICGGLLAFMGIMKWSIGSTHGISREFLRASQIVPLSLWGISTKFLVVMNMFPKGINHHIGKWIISAKRSMTVGYLMWDTRALSLLGVTILPHQTLPEKDWIGVLLSKIGWIIFIEQRWSTYQPTHRTICQFCSTRVRKLLNWLNRSHASGLRVGGASMSQAKKLDFLKWKRESLGKVHSSTKEK